MKIHGMPVVRQKLLDESRGVEETPGFATDEKPPRLRELQAK